MSRANIDVRRTVQRTRTQTASVQHQRLLLQSSNGIARLPESQSTIASKRNIETETQDINQLLDIIENQRGGLEQRAAIIQKLQSDINAMGKLLVEERSKAAHYNQMYIIAEKEKEAAKKIPVPETRVTSSLTASAPQVEKKLAQENFLLKTDLDNIQHQLSLKKLILRIKGAGQENEHLTVAVSQITELNNRMEEYENISQLLQTQVVWLNREHTKLADSNTDKDAHIRELEIKLQQVTIEALQKSDGIDRLNVELANRRLELEKRGKEIKELKETVTYLQQMSDHHSYQIKMTTFNEDDLKRKIQYFKTEALVIADKLGSAQREKAMLEEKFRGQQQAREDLMMSVELLRKQQQEERNKLSREVEEAKLSMKVHSSNVQELEAELQKRGEGHDKLNYALKSKQDELDRLTEEVGLLKTEKTILQQRLADVEPSIKAAKSQVLKLEAELTQAEIQTADYEQLQQENEVLKDRCFVIDRERSTLQKVLDDAAAKIEAMGMELAKEKTQVKDSEADLQELKKEAMNVHTLKSACQQLQMLLGQAQEDKRMMAITVSVEIAV